MKNIICDICGTEYPETEETCPICGCSRDMNGELELEEEDFLADSPITSALKQDGKFVAADLGADFLEDLNLDEEPKDEDDEDEDDEEEETSRGRAGVVILLTVVIILLLAISGYLFVRYLLPNMGGDAEPTETTQQTEAVVETTTEPGIPCEQLILMSGAAVDLTREGEYRLINVIVLPEDTTDKVEYYSADETIATVNAEGRVTGISEGETVITIVCGSQRVECRVFVHYEEPTEEPTEEMTFPTEAEETQAEESEATEEAEETEATEPMEETEATEATQAQTGLKDVVLKLGRTDISMGVGYEFTIPLDCDLTYEEIEWSTGNPGIAIIENGVVKTLSRGTTQLFAKYGDQVVTGWIRVK